MWAEKLGIVNMSSNYSHREVPTKRLKKNCSLRLRFLHKSPIVPQFGCCVYFFVWSLYLPSTLCVHMCVYYCRCVTARAHSCRCVSVSLALSFCRTVSVCLDIIRLFFIVTVCLQMCATVLLRSPRDVSVWGNRKKHSACACWLGLLIVIKPRTGERGCCPEGNEPAFGSHSTYQSKGRRHVFFHDRKMVHRDVSKVNPHYYIYF